MNILILGASGMLGHTMLRALSKRPDLKVCGTVRDQTSVQLFPPSLRGQLLSDVDVLNQDQLLSIMSNTRPDIIINCVGMVKQLKNADDPLVVLPINSIFPHRLKKICDLINARLIHISTDCVFSGECGNYGESAVADATDLYGRSKYIGEVTQSNAVTLRTSIIGHELARGRHGLLEWFLAQAQSVLGFEHAFFSGVTTNELARILADYVFPNENLTGIWHVSSSRISKLSLLRLIAEVYSHAIDIVPNSRLKIDRSLNSTRFQAATGFRPSSWEDMLISMRDEETTSV